MDQDTPPSPDKGSSAGKPQASGIGKLWQELRRRKVVRVAMVYIITGWIIFQVAGLTFENFGIPVWAFRFVTLMVVLGFPLAVIVAWAFELTPQGIKTTKSAQAENACETKVYRVYFERNSLVVRFHDLSSFCAHLVRNPG